MNLLFTVNDSYAPWASVLLSSILSNNEQMSFDVYVISIDISLHNIKKLTRQLEAAGSQLHIIRMSSQQMRELEAITNLSTSGLNINYNLRLALDSALPADIDKILYLDTDMIVNGSLKELDNFIFKPNVGAAVVQDVVRLNDYQRLSFSHVTDRYFNSGMLLINLHFWRAHEVGKKCLEYLASHPNSPMPDQDALNTVLRGKVDYIHPRYNFLTLFCARDEELRKRVSFRQLTQIREVACTPTIIHFVNVNKPWFLSFKIPFKEVWRRYYQMSPYSSKILWWRDGVKGLLRNTVIGILGGIGIKKFKSIY